MHAAAVLHAGDPWAHHLETGLAIRPNVDHMEPLSMAVLMTDGAPASCIQGS